jgi:acyl-coenzyme A thioesterase PaaI-like protein
MVCGPANPDGWGMRLRIAADRRVHGTVVFDRRHEGAPGVVHGGAVAAVLDDTLGSVPLALRTPAVTVNLNIDYRAQVPLDRELVTEAWCERVEGRKIHLAGRLLDGATVLAETTALFLEMPPGHFQPADGEDWVNQLGPA